MRVTDPLVSLVVSVGSLESVLPSLIDQYRTKAQDPPPAPSQAGKSHNLPRVYQYSRLQTLLDATHPWEWKDLAGTVRPMAGQRAIWATSAPYMNDRKEYKHGCAILCAAVKRRKRKRNKGPHEDAILECLSRLLSQPLGRKFYVACFSQKSDDLGQWRGYGDWGKGVCLGYNYTQLIEVQPWFAGWVIYEPETQAKVADLLIHEIVLRIRPVIELDPSRQDYFLATATELLQVILPAAILLMKDPAFRDEAEFRLIHAEDAPASPQVKYRVRESRVIPYIEMGFEDAYNLGPVSAPLEEVVLGPGCNDELNIQAVRGLLASRGLTAVDVVSSPIPFLP